MTDFNPSRISRVKQPLSIASSTSSLIPPASTPLFRLPAATPVVTRPQQVFWLSVFLVVVPVFFQAPLVRSLPWLSLALTGTWAMAGISLMSRGSHNRMLGDLLVGFTWTWLAGSLYWGWLRWEPFVHMPVEALGLPIALASLAQGKGRVGSYFYLGSLFGTAVTDLYIYMVDLVPIWRQVMIVDPDWAPVLFQRAVEAIQNPVAIFQALLLAVGLLAVGLVPLRSSQACWWAFSGAVLSTLIVDLLFLLSTHFV